MEVKILVYSIVLGLVQLFAQSGAALLVRGGKWGAGARDEQKPELPKPHARLGRSFYNFMETFPFFAAAVLLVQIFNKSSDTTVLGCEIYLIARILYVPVYVAGIPFVRTLIWTVSVAGIIMVLSPFFAA